MAERPVNPARLDGEALKRWYLRSPDEIEQERQARQASLHHDFFANLTSANEPSKPAEAREMAQPDQDLLWISDGRGRYRAVRRGSSDFEATLRSPQDADHPDYLPENAAAPEDGRFEEIGNPHNPRLRREWERSTGKAWPKTEDGRNYHVAHIRAIADGGTNTLDNIQPMHPDLHVASHIENGDSARWARRWSTARAFGGEVEKSVGRVIGAAGQKALFPLQVGLGILGVLTGDTRLDSEHFANDMMGYASPDDMDRAAERACKSMGITTPGAQCY